MQVHAVTGHPVAPIDPICRRLIAAGLARPNWPYKSGRINPDRKGFLVAGDPFLRIYVAVGAKHRHPETGIMWVAADEGAGPELVPDLEDDLLIGWLYGQVRKVSGRPFDLLWSGSDVPEWETCSGGGYCNSIGAALNSTEYLPTEVETLLAALERCLAVRAEETAEAAAKAAREAAGEPAS